MSDDRDPRLGLPFLPPVDPAASRAADAGAAVTAEAFAGFLVDGDAEIARWALERQLAVRPRTEVYDTFVRDAMRVVGDRWLSGRWTISEEHLASRTLTAALTALAPEETPAARLDPVAVSAGVAGEEHSIGLLALSHVLRESGFAVSDLGPNVPPDDLVRFVAKTDACLVALSASSVVREEMLRATVAALRALPGHPAIIVAAGIADQTDLTTSGADWAGTSLVECARFAQNLALRTSGPGSAAS